MSDDKKAPHVTGWLEAGAASPKTDPKTEHGPNGQMLRRLAEINPSLKGGDSTAEFIANAKGQLAASGPRPRPLDHKPIEKAKDVDHLFELSRVRFDSERRELETQISMLQQKLAGMKTRHLGEVMDQLAVLDPNLAGVVTQAALKTHQAFLGGLGFSPQKFIERLRQKRQ